MRVPGAHEEHVVGVGLEAAHDETLLANRVGRHHPALVRLVTEVLHPVRLHGRRAVVGVGLPRQQHARLVDEADVGAGGRTREGRGFGRSVEDDVRVGVCCNDVIKLFHYLGC